MLFVKIHSDLRAEHSCCQKLLRKLPTDKRRGLLGSARFKASISLDYLIQTLGSYLHSTQGNDTYIADLFRAGYL